MDVQETGLTLEGLAQKFEALERENTERLEALERENEQMRSENAELRSKVTELEGSGTRRYELAEARSSERRLGGEPVSVLEGRVSRRSLLSRAGAAAVAAVAAGTLLNPRQAKANHYDTSDIEANLMLAHHVITDYLSANGSDDTYATVNARNLGSGPGVHGESETAAVEGEATGLSGIGVVGKTKGSNGTGVKGTGRYGVWGESDQAGFYGVFGRNTRTDGTGVRGVGTKRGVLGESTNGTGIYGTSSAPSLGAVEGHNSGLGSGVVGVGRVGMLAFSHTNGWIAAWGRHTANGYGVAGDSAQGVGVSGESTSGYGGQFKGGKAQLMLIPGSVAGKPTSGTHTKGEVYMDSKGTLFVCTAGDGTTVGTWKKVTMKLV